MSDRPTEDRLARMLDRALEPFAPRLVRRRMAERLALHEMRQYDAGARGRRTDGWKRSGGSADREIRGALAPVRNGVRELVRNNKYAAAALRQMTANVVGDGITARMTHPNKKVARRAQDEWDRWAEGRIDGREDHYGQQKLAFRAAAEGGESLAVWGPGPDGLDGRCFILEGDLLDHTKELDTTAKRIVQGVEFDGDGFRSGYWLFDRHPGDLGGYRGTSRRFAAEHVDHVFESLRPGQTRGISWFAPVAMDLRDLADYEDAVLMKRKIEACLALVLTPPEGGTPTGPFDDARRASGEGAGTGGSAESSNWDRLRPGMVFRARPGETATSVNPSAGGDGGDLLRQRLMGVAANTAPYFLISGDPSRSNYTSQRGAMMGFWANLDDWQWNMMVPQFCAPAVARRNRWLAIKTGDPRFLQVKPEFAMPVRRLLDPGKDLTALERELRLGALSYPAMLNQRGIDPAEHVAEIAAFFEMADKAGLVFDGDPRRTARSGTLQAAVVPAETDDD